VGGLGWVVRVRGEWCESGVSEVVVGGKELEWIGGGVG